MGITASINVQGSVDNWVEQLSSTLQPFFVFGIPFLEEGWCVGWAEKRFTNSTGILPYANSTVFFEIFKPARISLSGSFMNKKDTHNPSAPKYFIGRIIPIRVAN